MHNNRKWKITLYSLDIVDMWKYGNKDIKIVCCYFTSKSKGIYKKNSDHFIHYNCSAKC